MSKRSDITIIRSQRKSISLEIRPDLQVYLRVPSRMTNQEIDLFLQRKSDWLEKHRNIIKERKEQQKQYEFMEQKDRQKLYEEENQKNGFAMEEWKALTEKARRILPERVRLYAPAVGVDFGRITIRHQKTRWGSCSAKGNLNFNCMLVKMPQEVMDYVIIHELCHRLEMNHSKRFWAEVERVCPEYRQRIAWLKMFGNPV